MKSEKPEYLALGHLLAQARRDAGLQNQSDLASLMKTKKQAVSQQTVSRWEAGTSRPRASQIPDLAKALKLDPSRLLELAGYASPTVTSFDMPFPVDQLPPETFERFVEYLVDRLFGGAATVRRAGGLGHKQDGLDVIAMLPDGKVHTFQCKRHKQFGPADVAKVIAAHTEKADVKHLVLSRVASPQAAQALERAGWVLWDKEILSRLIRSRLSEEDQNRLVDIFFRGRRQELLGRSEPGPWMTVEAFFAPFEGRTRTFNHTLVLKGRETEITNLTMALQQANTPVVLLCGPGGIGKSRILMEALAKFERAHPTIKVRILSSAQDATVKDLEGLGGGQKILVVDDAHDRDGLGVLLHYVAIEENHARLLLSTRPYAEARIKREAALVGIDVKDAIRVDRLSKKDSIALAKEVLAERNINPDFAEQIVEHVGDNPLVTVMAARVIAEEGVPLEVAKNAQVLRNTILGKFEKVIIGDLGSPGDEKLLKDMLDVLALVQPFHIEDPSLIALLQKLRGIDAADSARLLRLLLEGGLIYRRGHHYRLMPDLLGDYIIEQSCIGPNRKLSPFAERAFDAVEAKQLEHVMVNLGRMDWRLSGGDPSASTLLDGVWRKFNDITEEYDWRLDAISAVAIYQPRRALEFVEDKIRRNITLSELPQILRSIAYNADYTMQACAALWELGKNNAKDDGYRFENPVSVLEKLCSFEESKPVEFSEIVFNFAMALSENDAEWEYHHTPLQIMLPVLSTEGMSTSSNMRTVTFRPFLINYDNVKPLRDRLIVHILSLLEHQNLRIARRAAAAVDQALRGPWGMARQQMPQSLERKYEVEFSETIHAINKLVEQGRLHPVVLLTLAPHMSWMAEHAALRAQEAAQKFLQLLPKSLDFRLLATLVKGNGSDLTAREFQDGWQERNEAWIVQIGAELKEQYSNEELLDVLEEAIRTLHDAGITQLSPHFLVNHLISGDLALARTFVAIERGRTKSHLRRLIGAAVLEIMSSIPAEGQSVVKQFLASADDNLAWAAAASFGALKRKLDERDISLLRTALSSPRPAIASAAIHSLWGIRLEEDPRLLIDLSKEVHFEAAPRLADEIFMMFRGRSGIMRLLTKADVQHFLDRLKNIPEIDNYHTQDFIAHVSEHFPFDLVNFFLARMETAVKLDSYSFRPANYGPYTHVPLRFHKSAEASAVLARIWSWLRENSDNKGYVFNEHAANLFEAIFPEQANTDLAQFFDAKIESSNSVELGLMCHLLRKASPDFVFAHRPFVIRFLERCRTVDPKLVKRGISSLASAAMSGVKGGKVGEPFERDVRQRDESKKILAVLPRFSPAYDLYDHLYRTAEREISDRAREWEAMDEE